MSTPDTGSARPTTTGPTEVVHVTPFFPPALGGLENVACALSEELAKRRPVRVLTTTCGSGGAPRREPAAGEVVRRCRGVRVAHTPVSPGLVWQLLRTPRSSVVHAHLAHAFLPEVVWATSRLRRRPYVVHFHLDVDPSGPLGFLLAGYKQRVFGPVLRGAARVITLSDSQSDFLARTYRVPRARLTAIPNGVPAAFESLAREAEEASTPDAPLRLLFVGRLDPQKNVARLLDALAATTAAVDLVVVGDGQERQRLADQADRLGLSAGSHNRVSRSRVQFVGAERGTSLHRRYARAQAFVLPSDREGMPLAVLEAMAAGLPVLATDVPGTRELVAGAGLLVAPDPAALAAGLDRLAGDPGLRADLARRSRERGRGHRWDERARQVEQVYTEVAAAHQGSR